jgi:hypothetical protein
MADYTININAKDNTKAQFSNINTGLAGMTAGAGKFKAALGAAGAALAAFGIGAKIKGAIDDFDNLAKSARMAGATASNEAFKGFQVLQTAMSEAGIDAATFERAMLQTTSRLKAGTEGQKSFAAVTDKLGDSILDMNGNLKSGPELLKEMMNALNAGKITTEEFAKVVGGRAGPLIQQQFASLNTSAEALEATLADVEGSANIVPLGAAENAEVFNDTLGRLGMALEKLLTDAITPLLPHLTKFAQELLANMPAIVDKVSAAFGALEPVFGLIGTVLTQVVFPVLQKVFEVLGFIAEAISPLVDSAIPALKAGFEGLQGIVDAIVGAFTKVVDTLGAIGDKAKELKDGTVGVFTDMKDGVVNKAGELKDGVVDGFNSMYDKVFGGSIVPDMVDGVLSEFDRMNQGVKTTTIEMTATVTTEMGKMGDSIQNDFANTLESALSDGKLSLSDFEGFFKKTITNLITESIRGGNGIGSAFSGLFGGGGGSGGGIGSMIGSIASSFFGGFFADGGNLGARKFGIVGENGPEIITGPAQITPMSDMATGGSVSININAIDTQTGTQFLLDNKGQIQDIIQKAFNRHGKVGIV